ncbi:MAG: nucleoside hydrolase [Alphaproteobacteria bacterium]|nr:nucleoside hydrolase [Alphaproteobacteria bacterium]
MAIPLIIDCDPGRDDAIALLLALASPDAFEMIAVTTVSGNVPLALSHENARRLLAAGGRADVPVHAGAAAPLARAPVHATHVHGETGLAGAELPPSPAPPTAQDAAGFLVETLAARPAGSVTIAALGPLTNLAIAIARAPDTMGRLGRLVLMGGAIGPGNVTPAAEFNIHADPDAAARVFAAGFALTMIPLDLTHRLRVTPARIAAIAATGRPMARIAAGILAAGRVARPEPPGEPLHDPAVIAWLIRPQLMRGRRCHVAVETADTASLGRTIVDWSGVRLPPNAMVLDRADADGFFALLTERLGRS